MLNDLPNLVQIFKKNLVWGESEVKAFELGLHFLCT